MAKIIGWLVGFSKYFATNHVLLFLAQKIDN
jgi:hypothetical protein